MKPLTDSTPLRTGAQDRLSSLDIARSFAAIAVVLWHWQHFQFSGNHLREGFDRTVQPLYSLLFPFYEGGWFAVDFFFMLSGYIFFWKYRASINDGRVGAGPFFVLRFSRLYPLHLATLLVVAGLQTIYAARHGAYFVFPYNDLYHFVLQVFLASHWGLERGPSFNDPVWSLSVEALLYAMFFVVAKYSPSRMPLLAALAALGFLLFAANLSNAVGRGMFCFFVGGMLPYAIAAALRSRLRPVIEAAVYVALPLAVIGVLMAWRHGLVGQASQAIGALVVQLNAGLAPLQDAISGRLSRVMIYALMTALLFPLLIAALVLLERRFHAHIHRWSFLGNISYSSYLLHIPLQLACVLLFPAWFSDPAIAASGASMLAFLVVLIGLSFASFYGFEQPAQTAIRRRILGAARKPMSGNEIRSRALPDHLADPAPAGDIVAPR